MSDYEYQGGHHLPIVGRDGDTAWDLASEHRFRWMRLLPPRPEGQRRGIIGIVGVEDGNAIDITKLLGIFHEVHLVDPDEDRLRRLIASQKVTEPHRVHFHAKMKSLSGIEPVLAEYDSDPSDANFQKLMEVATRYTWGDVGQFSELVSFALWPMLTRFADHFVDHPERFELLVAAIRGRHVELLLEHTLPAGAMFMIMRLVSSDTIPLITQKPAQLTAICNQAIESKNFYVGSNPQAVLGWITAKQELREISSGFRMFDPWIYEQPELHSIYYAIRMNRLAETDD